MDVYHFKNFEMLDPEVGELRGGHELVVEGDTDQGSLGQADQACERPTSSTAAGAR